MRMTISLNVQLMHGEGTENYTQAGQRATGENTDKRKFKLNKRDQVSQSSSLGMSITNYYCFHINVKRFALIKITKSLKSKIKSF